MTYKYSRWETISLLIDLGIATTWFNLIKAQMGNTQKYVDILVNYQSTYIQHFEAIWILNVLLNCLVDLPFAGIHLGTMLKL